MHLVTRLRWVIARHPSLRWIAVGSCTLVVASTVHRLASEAAAARERWGTSVDVVVAVAETRRGEPLAVTVQPVPLAMVPDGALDAAPAPGELAAQHLTAGEIVTVHDVADDAVPDGWVVLALDTGAPPVTEGDRVAVLGGGAVLCEGLVTGTDGEGRIDVAMPVACATRASEAVSLGEILLGRLG